MNILILNWRDRSHPKSGGAEIVTMEHAKGWVRMGHQVTWLTGWYAGAKHEEIIDGVTIVRHAGSLTIYIYAIWYLLLHRNTYDVIVDEVHGFPFFSPLFTQKPVVMFIHEIAGEIWDYMFSFPKNTIGKCLEFLYLQLYRNCFIWTDAPSTVKELVARGMKKEQCVAIPCPITVSNKLQVTSYKSKEKVPTYIFVSRLVKMKGIEEVVKAFSFIAKEQLKAHLWIVGSGEEDYVQSLKVMVYEYGIAKKVTFKGNVSEKEKFSLMGKAHILLHASVKEGWGLVVLEAAYVGTPAIVYNVGGLCDVVKSGKTGVVVEDNSPQTMAKEAIKLMNDKKRYSLYQKEGKHWVLSLQWEEVVKESEKLLRESSYF